MTKKEKEVFSRYKDSAYNKMVNAFTSGNPEEISKASSEFILLTGLWNELNGISEVGA